jgi:hypothetical protein
MVYFSLYLTDHHPKKMDGGVEIHLHTFLTSTLDRWEWLASRSGRFIPEDRTSCTHWLGKWARARAGLDALAKRKKSLLLREINSLFKIRLTDEAMLSLPIKLFM